MDKSRLQSAMQHSKREYSLCCCLVVVPVLHVIYKTRMIMANKLSLVLVLVASYAALSSARTFTVGDDQGWMSGIDYTNWTIGKTFAIGDKLLFSYRSQYHTVTEVSKSGYYTCSTSDALSDDTSGWTVVTLTAPGTRYFICNIPGLCISGMKLSITVADESGPVPSDATRGTLVLAMGSVFVAVATRAVINLF